MEKLRDFLVDNNILLERLLNQEKAGEVKRFLETVPAEHLLISDFTLHSIGIILFKLNRQILFNKFIHDLFINGRLQLIGLNPIDQLDLLHTSKSYKLDFDDAYQHTIVEKYDLNLVSFDKDFRKAKVKMR